MRPASSVDTLERIPHRGQAPARAATFIRAAESAAASGCRDQIYMNLMHSLNLNARITRTRERFTTNVCGRKRLSRHITDCLVCATQLRSDDEIFDMRFIFWLDWPIVASTRCVPLKGFELSYTFDHTPHRLYFCSAAGPWSTVITCSPAIDGDPFPVLRVSPMALASRRCSSRSSKTDACDASHLAEKVTAGEHRFRSATSREVRIGRAVRGRDSMWGCRTRRPPACLYNS